MNTNLEKLFRDYFDSVNNFDADEVLRYLADDFSICDSDENIIADKYDDLKMMIEWDIGTIPEYSIGKLSVNENKVTATVSEVNEIQILFGLKKTVYDVSFYYEGDLIKKQVYSISSEDPWDDHFKKTILWAKSSRLDLISAFDTKDNEIEFNGRSAEAALSLIRTWKAENENK